MKISRIIGLAAVAALALMASAGAGSASAYETTLCKTSTHSPYCGSEDRYAKGTSLQASSSNVTINTTTPKLVITCAESKLAGETSAETGAPMPLSISAWTLGGCKSSEPAECTLTPTKSAPYAGSLSWKTGSDGLLTVVDGGTGKPEWRFQCGELLDCFLSLTPELDLTGGTTASIVATAESMSKKSGGVCPKTTTFSGTYSVSSPKPAYIAQPVLSEAHTRLCKAAESPCSLGNTYSLGTTIEAEAPKMSIKVYPTATINCGKTTAIAKSQALGAEPLPLGGVELATSECSSSTYGNCTVTINQSKLATSGSIKSTGIYSGTIILMGESFKFKCGQFYTCTLKTNLVATPFYGSGVYDKERATFFFEEAVLKGEELCSEGRLSASFTVTSPKPLFAT